MNSRAKQDRVTAKCLGGQRIEFREGMRVKVKQNASVVNVQYSNVIAWNSLPKQW